MSGEAAVRPAVAARAKKTLRIVWECLGMTVREENKEAAQASKKSTNAEDPYFIRTGSAAPQVSDLFRERETARRSESGDA